MPPPHNLKFWSEHLPNIQMASHKYDIIVMCESFLKPHHTVTLEDFIIIPNNQPTDQTGRKAIYILKNIPFNIANNQDNLD